MVECEPGVGAWWRGVGGPGEEGRGAASILRGIYLGDGYGDATGVGDVFGIPPSFPEPRFVFHGGGDGSGYGDGLGE